MDMTTVLQAMALILFLWLAGMYLYRLFLSPSEPVYAPLVLPVGGGADSLEGRLRWTLWQARCGGRQGRIFILDCGMDSEAAQICLRFSREHDCVEMGDIKALERRLSAFSQLQL